MPGLMTDYAAGATAYATPEIIQTELANQRALTAAQQANTARTQQTTQIEGYQLRDLQALSGLSRTPGQVPEQARQPTALQGASFQNITGIAGLGDTASTDEYLQFQREQQQFTELQGRLQSTQQKYDAVVDPERKKFFRDEMNSIQKEMTSSQDKQNKKQGEMTKKLYSPIIAANDNLSWNIGRAQLAKDAANAAVAKAIQEKIPEENLEKVRSDAYKSAFNALPSSYNNTAKNIQANVQQQLESSEGRQKEMKADTDYQKAQLDMQKTDLEMKKLKVETNKLQADLQNGKTEKKEQLFKERGAYVTQSRTAELALKSDRNQIKLLEDELKLAEEAATPSLFKSDATIATATSERDRIKGERDLLLLSAKDKEESIIFADQQRKITEEKMKAQGLSVSKPEPVPSSKIVNMKEIETAAKQSWGSYEPKVYEYRVLDGKLQRKVR